MGRIQHPEDDIQRAVVTHLRARGAPGIVFWHTPNSSKLGGRRTRDGVPLEAIRLKALGFRTGVSDLIVLHQGGIFILELKVKGNSPTEEQIKFMADAEAAGAKVAVAYSLNDAIRQLEAWGLLRGKSF